MKKAARFVGQVAMALFVGGVALALYAPRAEAASTCTFASVGTSDWNTAANWSCSGAVNAVPTSTTDVVIPATTSTAISASADAGTLSIATGGELLLGDGNCLGSCTLTVASSTTIAAGGTLNLYDESLFVGGNWANSGTLSIGVALVTFNGSETQTISEEPNFPALTINKSTGTALLLGYVTTSRGVTLTSGTFNLAGKTLSAGGSWTNGGGTLVAGGGTVRFTVTGSVTGETNFYNVVVNGSTSYNGFGVFIGTTLTLASDTTIAGALSINAGRLRLGSTTLTLSGSGTPLYILGEGINDGIFDPQTGTTTFAGLSPVVASTTYYNLSFTGSGTATFQEASTTVANDIVISSGTVDLGSSTLHVGRHWTDGGTFTGGTGTVEFYGATAQTISAEPGFYNVVINKSDGTATLGGNATSSNNFTLTSGTFDLGSSTLHVGGNWSGSGTFIGSTGTIDFVGAGTQTIVGEPSFYNFSTSKSGGSATIMSSSTIAGTLVTSGAGALRISSAGGVSILGAVTIGSGTTYLVNAATSTMASTLTNNGTITITTGTVTSTGAFTNGGTISMTTGMLALGDAFTNTGTFTRGTGTTRLFGATSPSIAGVIYNNLESIKSGGTATIAASSTVMGTLVTSVGGTLAIDTAAGMTVMGTATIGSGSTFLVNGTATSSASFTNAGTVNGGTGTLVIATTFSNSGTFTPSTGTVRYASSTTQNVLATNYNNIEIRNSSASGALLTASTTAVGTVNVQSGATFVVGAYVFTALGTITNNGLVTEDTGGGGKIIHPAESVKLTNSAGTEANFTTGDSIYITVQDSNLNLDASVAETFTIGIAGNSAAGSDSETLTLTETGVATGIFRNSTGLVFANSTVASTGNGQFEVIADGVGTTSYTDSQDASDNDGSDTATLTYTAATAAAASSGGGGGGGSGYIPITITSQVSTQSNTANLTNLQNIGVAVHNLVKLPNDEDTSTQYDSAVYYIGSDGKRHAFPNEKVFFTWYVNFDGVQVINQTQLASIPLGSNITYKPGVKMVKFTTDPKVYVVAKGGALRWVSSEASAIDLYDVTWNTQIDDISDAFYSNYTFGTSVTGLADFNPTSVTASVSLPSDSLQM